MFYIIIIFLIFIDLYTKFLSSIYLKDKIEILGDFVYLKYVENTWIAFSIYINPLFLKIITIVLIIIIFYLYKKFIYNSWKINKLTLIDYSAWFILAWAIWNWYERIFNEKVIDFIWIKYFSIFNMADFFISIWAIMYLFFLYKQKKI